MQVDLFIRRDDKAPDPSEPPGMPPIPGTEPEPGRAAKCASCGDIKHTFGPVVCWSCLEQGYCSVCGEAHRPTQCPDVVRARLDMEAAERLMHTQLVRDWASRTLRRYEAEPIGA